LLSSFCCSLFTCKVANMVSFAVSSRVTHPFLPPSLEGHSMVATGQRHGSIWSLPNSFSVCSSDRRYCRCGKIGDIFIGEPYFGMRLGQSCIVSSCGQRFFFVCAQIMTFAASVNERLPSVMAFCLGNALVHTGERLFALRFDTINRMFSTSDPSQVGYDGVAFVSVAMIHTLQSCRVGNECNSDKTMNHHKSASGRSR
jgi:hypothetical protein